MSRIGDNTYLCDLNIPGSHDAAAIRKSSLHSIYSCQDRTIEEQLRGGVRLFDIRIKVKELSETGFITCHQLLGFGTPLDEFESLGSVFDAFNEFLENYSKEVVIVSLKIDEWGPAKECHDVALSHLLGFLKGYNTYRESTMPKLGEVRGRIYLLNRIDDTLNFGVPLNIGEKCEGTYLEDKQNRNFKAFVQDKWFILNLTPTSVKFQLVLAAMNEKKDQPGILNMNFASVNYFFTGVYIMKDLLSWFGRESVGEGRSSKLGWVLFDYGFNKVNTERYGYIDIIEFMIDSNFHYEKFPSCFKVTD